MESILCLSYYPFIFLESKKKKVKIYHFMTNSLNLFEENLKYKIFCLFHYNNSNFFISSNEFIYHYEFKENNLLERNKIYISNDIIKYALYDSNTDRIYGMNNSTLTIYCLKKRKKIYQFHHFNKIIVDKYRYIYFPPKKFLQILQSLFFSFFSTKNHIKKCCSIIWTHLHNLNFKFRGIFRDFYIFTAANEFIMIHRQNFLLHTINISDIIRNCNYNFLFDYYLFLVTYTHEENSLKFQYYYLNGNNFFFLYQHEIFFSKLFTIQEIEFYLYHQFHFIYIKTEKENFFISLFHFHEKFIQLLWMQKEYVTLFEKQIELFDKILFQKETRLEEENKRREISRCCICYENNVNIIFLPCSHICCCHRCSFLVENCPLCRKKILFKKNCYILTN